MIHLASGSCPPPELFEMLATRSQHPAVIIKQLSQASFLRSNLVWSMKRFATIAWLEQQQTSKQSHGKWLSQGEPKQQQLHSPAQHMYFSWVMSSNSRRWL
eukprot:CAMPEP_0177295310 /NCGR_PEP_ID=MMETSP0368-20130122/1792_1 /TAXON_ID=447022 ORGANISM="Scrippsiella hangoei-like, Strain SHHI-4" /NCGR_SAMPLE_ID=MMETSP0368 /ASSEMBLY_ACC=CAM_ASM_000363 /LENGTH=100 /DNA_ID=CAMNT_0018753303 /DNA_START=226 /DNA_END=528 /DNA_ORIENTATION=-